MHPNGLFINDLLLQLLYIPECKNNDSKWGGGGCIEGSIQLNECIPTELLAVETQQTWSGYSPTVNHDASQCSLPLSIVSALFALLPMCQNCSHPQHATSLPWLLPLPVSFTQLSVSLPLMPRITFSPLSHFVFSHQPLSLPPASPSLHLHLVVIFCLLNMQGRVTRYCNNVSPHYAVSEMSQSLNKRE